MKLGRFVLLAAVAAGLAAPAAQAGTLDKVKARGTLVCGVNPALAGFGLPDDKGNYTGLDVDFCHALAAAVFGDPSKVKYVALNATDRLPALQAGSIDVLARNTTWTSSRDQQGLLFGAVNFYDGQGFMVTKKLNVSSAKDLNGASVCVQQGTTTELNLADYFRSNNMKYDSVVFKGEDETLKAFEAGRCDAFTTDSSGLYAERIRLANPDDYVVLPEIISKEPLSPAVQQGDDQWFNVVRWTHWAMITAEEDGVTSKNVDEQLKSDNPDVRRLLGVEGDVGHGFGLDSKWAYNIVKTVGNYGEMFDRNVGDGSPLKIKRGLNALWKNGGLQYAPPIR